MSSLGPVSLKGWECSKDYLPCFRDCCLRGSSFCHHGERRCKKCETRESECGNYTLPWECDAYCVRKALGTGPLELEGSELVSPGYMYATYVLATLFAMLLTFGLIKDRHCKKHHSHLSRNTTDDSLLSENESLSLTESSLDDKETQTDLDSLAEDIPNDHAKVAFHLSAQPMSYDVNPSQMYNAEREVLQSLGRETIPKGTQVYDIGQSVGLPQDRGEQQIHQPSTAEQPPSPPHVQSVSYPCQCYPRECHDPRLDNISPSSDAENNVVSVHNG